MTTSPSTTLSSCWPLKRIGRPGSRNSWSLSNATRLPQNVTPPMRPESTVATVSCMVGASMPGRTASWSAAPATSTDAPPPKPLSSATICGMAVICTIRASMAPSTPPTTMPPAMMR